MGRRSGRPYRRFRKRVLETWGPMCWLCRLPIDLTLPHQDRMAYTVEHLDPLSLGGSLLDLDRARPAHRSCNSSRGNRPIVTTIHTRQEW